MLSLQVLQNMTKIILARVSDWWAKLLPLLFFRQTEHKLFISHPSLICWYHIQTILVMHLLLLLTVGLAFLCCRTLWTQLKAFKTLESHNFRVFILRRGYVVVACTWQVKVSLHLVSLSWSVLIANCNLPFFTASLKLRSGFQGGIKVEQVPLWVELVCQIELLL